MDKIDNGAGVHAPQARAKVVYNLPEVLEAYTPIQWRELPFVIGVIGNFAGKRPESFITENKNIVCLVDKDNFHARLKQISPTLSLSIGRKADDDCDELDVTLTFEKLNDFEPDNVKTQLFKIRNEAAHTASRDVRTSRDIDDVVSKQVAAITKYPEFQRLAAAWLRLYFLSQHVDGTNVQIRLIQISKEEALADLLPLIDVRASTTFGLIYGRDVLELDTDRLGILICDYEFSFDWDNVRLLDQFSRIAANALCVFIAGVDPTFLETVNLRANLDCDAGVGQTDSAQLWNDFRNSDRARFVAIAVSCTDLKSSMGIKPILFRTRAESSPAYVIGARVASDLVRYHWCVSIKHHEFDESSGTPVAAPGTFMEIAEAVPENAGFDVIHVDKNGAVSVEKDLTVFSGDAGSVNLACMISLCRWMHYLLEMASVFVSRGGDISWSELYLNVWISRYVCTDGERISLESILTRPLKMAKVTLNESGEKAIELSASLQARTIDAPPNEPLILRALVPQIKRFAR